MERCGIQTPVSFRPTSSRGNAPAWTRSLLKLQRDKGGSFGQRASEIATLRLCHKAAFAALWYNFGCFGSNSVFQGRARGSGGCLDG